jgi:hypothetical protein
MPYCSVNGREAAAGSGEEEVRIFYQRYGHGATKVLLIIGNTMLPLLNSQLFKIFNFSSAKYLYAYGELVVPPVKVFF